MDLELVRRDIGAFADDEADVVVEATTGELLFRRLGKLYECSLMQDQSGGYVVKYEGESVPYRRFLSREVARLDVLAERMLARRPSTTGHSDASVFINGPGLLDKASSDEQGTGSALELLHGLCSAPAFASTRVVFVTADAGYGKTALLREYQRRQAKAFIENSSDYLFWHVDLQGRQLVRLSEALMGDLGELRVVGIYMASIVALIRHGLLVLAIDGFDELAAEQGSTEALGALAHLLEQLSSGGTVVAASRRTFFNADDYLQGARLLGSRVSPNCEFDNLRLLGWSSSEAVALLRETGVASPEETLEKLRTALGPSAEPVLSTPFLLAETARALGELSVPPEEWTEDLTRDLGGISGMVGAFLRREVLEKWRTQEGAPLLSFEQHVQLLTAIADEMWMSQTERLDLQTIQIIAEMLFEDWNLEHEIRSNLMEMLRMHVFLVAAYEAADESRSFPHVEYLRYFQANALSDCIREATERSNRTPLSRFLSTAQLPDVVAKHAARMTHALGIHVQDIVPVLSALSGEAWKPSSLQTSIGTLVPQLLSGANVEPCEISFRAVYPRMSLEGTRLENVAFREGQFVNCSLRDVKWKNVTFENCQFVEPLIENSEFADVRFENCDLVGLVMRADGVERTEFAPERMAGLLSSVGVQVCENGESLTDETSLRAEDTPGRKALDKILRTFQRTTAISEDVIQRKFGSEHAFVTDQVFPLMSDYGIVELDTWKGGGRPQARWLLRMPREKLLSSDAPKSELSDFWRNLDELHP